MDKQEEMETKRWIPKIILYSKDATEATSNRGSCHGLKLSIHNTPFQCIKPLRTGIFKAHLEQSTD